MIDQFTLWYFNKESLLKYSKYSIQLYLQILCIHLHHLNTLRYGQLFEKIELQTNII